jgi:hypothetical protein
LILDGRPAFFATPALLLLPRLLGAAPHQLAALGAQLDAWRGSREPSRGTSSKGDNHRPSPHLGGWKLDLRVPRTSKIRAQAAITASMSASDPARGLDLRGFRTISGAGWRAGSKEPDLDAPIALCPVPPEHLARLPRSWLRSRLLPKESSSEPKGLSQAVLHQRCPFGYCCHVGFRLTDQAEPTSAPCR